MTVRGDRLPSQTGLRRSGGRALSVESAPTCSLSPNEFAVSRTEAGALAIEGMPSPPVRARAAAPHSTGARSPTPRHPVRQRLYDRIATNMLRPCRTEKPVFIHARMFEPSISSCSQITVKPRSLRTCSSAGFVSQNDRLLLQDVHLWSSRRAVSSRSCSWNRRPGSPSLSDGGDRSNTTASDPSRDACSG